MMNERIYKSWDEVTTEIFHNEESIWYEAICNGDEVRVFTNNSGEYVISADEITVEGWEEVIL